RPVIAVVLAAVALRAVLIAVGAPPTNSDEATMGLAAVHIGAGHDQPVWFYGQAYMGTLEAYLAAPFVALFGPHTAVLRLPLLLRPGTARPGRPGARRCRGARCGARVGLQPDRAGGAGQLQRLRAAQLRGPRRARQPPVRRGGARDPVRHRAVRAVALHGAGTRVGRGLPRAAGGRGGGGGRRCAAGGG